MSEPLLPEMFRELEPFADWALEPERARIEKKVTASMEDIRAFYDAMMLRVNEIFDHLESHFGGDMPAPEYRLYLMSLSLVEAAILVEHYNRREADDACDPLRYVPRL